MPIKNNLEAMRFAFESAGVLFVYTVTGGPLGLKVGTKETAGANPGGEGVDPQSDR